MVKLKPMCLNKTSEGFAHTATGYIVPCCHVDYIYNDDPLYLDLLKPELKVSNNESIEEILLSDEWAAFGNAVVKGCNEHEKYAPKCCVPVCGNGGIECIDE